MSVPAPEAAEMQTENDETTKSNEMQQPADQTSEAVSTEENDEAGLSELALPRWSIVTFEGVAMSGLSYDEARELLGKLQKQNISGLCIVTEEAAARISK